MKRKVNQKNMGQIFRRLFGPSPGLSRISLFSRFPEICTNFDLADFANSRRVTTQLGAPLGKVY